MQNLQTKIFSIKWRENLALFLSEYTTKCWIGLVKILNTDWNNSVLAYSLPMMFVQVVSLLVQYTGPDSGRRGRAGDQLQHCHCQCVCVAIIILRQLPPVSSLTCDNLHWISVSSKVLITHDPHPHHNHPRHHHDHDVQEPRTTTTIATATPTAQKHRQRSDIFFFALCSLSIFIGLINANLSKFIEAKKRKIAVKVLR